MLRKNQLEAHFFTMLHAARDSGWLGFRADPPSNLLQPRAGRKNSRNLPSPCMTIEESSILGKNFIGTAQSYPAFKCPFHAETTASKWAE